jgi:hypothetical protein
VVGFGLITVAAVLHVLRRAFGKPKPKSTPGAEA